MKEINYRKIEEMPITIEVMNMISALHEYKGRQELYIETQPEILERLMEVARIQSTEASNKIEGIYTSDARLKEIVQKKSEPRNRNEKEIAGYREVLGMIHDSYSYIQLKPSDILTLHKYLYSYSESGNGGHYKMVDNYIEEEDEFGNKSVRFQPVPAVLTAEYIESLCKQYEDVINHTHIDPLLVIPCVILDFLCIHPFGDGNGRMSRLLTLLLLYKAGYLVGKYISIEMVVEKSKETYYEALQASSVGWHEDENSYEPFVKYYLGIMLKAYNEFENRVEHLKYHNLSKPDRIKAVIDNKVGKITKKEIMELCPDISKVTVERTLTDLVKSGYIAKVGAGPSTGYVRN